MVKRRPKGPGGGQFAAGTAPTTEPSKLVEFHSQPEPRYSIDEWPPQELSDLAETAMKADIAADSAIKTAYREIKTGVNYQPAITAACELATEADKAYDALHYAATEIHDTAIGAGIAKDQVYGGHITHLVDKSGLYSTEIGSFIDVLDENEDPSQLAEEVEDYGHILGCYYRNEVLKSILEGKDWDWLD